LPEILAHVQLLLTHCTAEHAQVYCCQ
jgi:hypothetical protein